MSSALCTLKSQTLDTGCTYDSPGPRKHTQCIPKRHSSTETHAPPPRLHPGHGSRRDGQRTHLGLAFSRDVVRQALDCVPWQSTFRRDDQRFPAYRCDPASGGVEYLRARKHDEERSGYPEARAWNARRADGAPRYETVPLAVKGFEYGPRDFDWFHEQQRRGFYSKDGPADGQALRGG